MEIFRREIFGTVEPLVEFHHLDEAIALTNDSDYGLTSSTYTRDLNVALRACREIRFCETYINRENLEAMQRFHSRWRNRGIKHGLYEFLHTHVVYLQPHRRFFSSVSKTDSGSHFAHIQIEPLRYRTSIRTL